MNRRHFLQPSSLGFSGALLGGALRDVVSAPMPKMKITKRAPRLRRQVRCVEAEADRRIHPTQSAHHDLSAA